MDWEQLELFEAPASYAPIEAPAPKLPKKRFPKWKQLEIDFNPPKNDKELYIRLQSEFRSGKQKSINEIYKLVQKIAYKMIGKEASTKGFFICSEERENKSYNCASYIVEQLITRNDFEIKEIGAYTYLRVRHELYYKTKLDDCLKLVQEIEPKKYFSNDY